MAKLGVVVVGIGIAGKVRVRDIWEYSTGNDAKANLIGYVTSQEFDSTVKEQYHLDKVTKITFDEALSRVDVNIIIVCTENARHEGLARRALENGKHVLVEYPLCTTLEGAKSLQEFAASRGLILHEEDISLLLNSFAELDSKINCEKKLARGQLEIYASLNNGWSGDFKASGSPFFTSINGIHWILTLFGDLKPVKAIFTKDEKSFLVESECETKDGKKIIFKVGRSEKGKREKKICIEFEDGSIIDKVPEEGPRPKPGLFQKDFLMFLDMVDGDKKLYEQWKVRTYKGIELAINLTKLAGIDC